MELTLPDAALVLLIGIGGCGKSTFAERHFIPTEVLSSDGCRAIVADDPNDQSATSDAFAVLRFILDKRLKRQLLSVVDATSLDRKARKPYLGLARKYGVPPVAIVLDLPFEVCLERDRQRSDRTVGNEVLRRQRGDLERGLRQLDGEGYVAVHILGDPDAVQRAEIVRELFVQSCPIGAAPTGT
ncbi:MAG: AAA family ATPase [Actinomycetota bacterium]|nr:AAA family ATPase [Actinomycetota bacterium]